MKLEEDFALWGPRDYVSLPPMPDQWRVLDVGPGSYPLKRADVYLDHDPDKLEPLILEGKETILGNLEDGLPEIADHAFDFCFISHVLEHCLELQTCVDTLNRIAKRGMMVVPSFAKDSIVFFEEREHIWHVLPNPTQGKPPIFVERNHSFVERLRDSTMQKAMDFLLRTGTHHDCTAERYMRGWYQANEPFLDIVQTWEPGRPLEAIIIR